MVAVVTRPNGHSCPPLDVIYNEDCLLGMQRIPDASIDMILCDLPYGTTAGRVDSVIPFGPLWTQYKRVVKRNAAIVLTASQPFTTALIASNIKDFKYSWVWEKSLKVGFQNANRRPLKNHEDICLFGGNPYSPQGLVSFGKPNKRSGAGGFSRSVNTNDYTQKYANYPVSILKIASEIGLHPTQKPVALFEYLIRTYTKEGETVLDNCIGSGTTAIACINSARHYVGFEKNEKYFQVTQKRIAESTMSGIAEIVAV